MSKDGRSRDRQKLRDHTRRVLADLRLEYVLDEVVRRLFGTGSGELTLVFREGHVVGRRYRPDRIAASDPLHRELLAAVEAGQSLPSITREGMVITLP